MMMLVSLVQSPNDSPSSVMCCHYTSSLKLLPLPMLLSLFHLLLDAVATVAGHQPRDGLDGLEATSR